VEQCLYRVAQEAVENVVRHASAKQVCVCLGMADGEIELVIQDDGKGFDANSTQRAGHFGLAGMQERARLAGGALSISSTPEHGTTVRLVIRESQP
jgi:signal transduction histidine kinase